MADAEDRASNVFSPWLWSSSTKRKITEMFGTVGIRWGAYRSRGAIKGANEATEGS